MRASMSSEPAFTVTPYFSTAASVGRSIRSAVNTTPSGSPAGLNPAARLRSISPSDTASTHAPSSRISFRIWTFEFAFCA